MRRASHAPTAPVGSNHLGMGGKREIRERRKKEKRVEDRRWEEGKVRHEDFFQLRDDASQAVSAMNPQSNPVWSALAHLFTSQIRFKQRQKGQDCSGKQEGGKGGCKEKETLRALSFCRLSPTHIISRAQVDSRGFKHL